MSETAAGGRRVIDSRKHGPIRYRTYLRADGTRYKTVELPRSALPSLTSPEIKKLVQTWDAQEARRARRALMEKRIREGVKPAAIAHELGISESYVRRVRLTMKKGR